MNGDEILTAAAAAIASAETLERVQEVVRTASRTVTRADGATFVLREGDRCFYADEDAIAPLWKGQRFPIEQCISGWAMLHREVARVPNIALDDRIPQDAYRPTFVRSLLMVPIIPGDGGDAVGAIGAYWADVRATNEADVAAVESLAAAAAGAISRLHADAPDV